MPTDFVREVDQEYVGKEITVELNKWFASEDFAYYLVMMLRAGYTLVLPER